MLLIGIDPGYSGALALYRPLENTLSISDMPVYKDPKGRAILDMQSLLDLLEFDPTTTGVVLEKVHAMPKQGVSSTFRFGEGYGALQMAIAAHKLPMQFVTPQKWKKYFGLSSDKGVSRGLATQRFPTNAADFKRVKDDGRAEAALIALYGYEALTKTS